MEMFRDSLIRTVSYGGTSGFFFNLGHTVFFCKDAFSGCLQRQQEFKICCKTLVGFGRDVRFD